MTRQIILAISTMWVARAAGIIASFLVLPILYRRLPDAALGVWLLLGQAGALIGFLDFGVGSVLMRRMAFASATCENSSQDAAADRLRKLLGAAAWLYRITSVCAMLVGLPAGWVFLGRMGLDAQLLAEARAAWAIVCTAQVINLGNGLWTAALSGLGQVATTAAIGSAVGLTSIATLALVAMLGGDILTLALVQLCASIVQRAATRLFTTRSAPGLRRLRARRDVALVRNLLAPSLRYWVTEIGAILLLRTDQFFIAGFRDAADIPAYYAGYAVIYHMAMVAMAVSDASAVHVARLWGEGQQETVRQLVIRAMRSGLALMLCGVAVMACIGDAVITVWLGPGRFVGWPVFLTFCAMLALFVQQSLLFGFSRATEHEVYARHYLAAGLINLVITWILIRHIGLLGVALGTLIAQLLTTNWLVPRTALRRLRIDLATYAADAVLPALGLATFTFAAVWLATCSLTPTSVVTRTLVGTFVGAAVMGVGFWIVIFDAPMRAQALRYADITRSRGRNAVPS